MAAKMVPVQSKLFPKCVSCILRTWSALELAVEHELGGPDTKEKASWMEEVIAQFFSENDNLEYFEVEDYLFALMNQEFDVIVEDGSLTKVSKDLCHLYHLCCHGDEKVVEDFLETNSKKIPLKIQLQDRDCSDVSEDERIEDMSSSDDQELEKMENLSIKEGTNVEKVRVNTIDGNGIENIEVENGIENIDGENRIENMDGENQIENMDGENQIENMDGENGIEENEHSEWTVVTRKKGKKKK